MAVTKESVGEQEHRIDGASKLELEGRHVYVFGERRVACDRGEVELERALELVRERLRPVLFGWRRHPLKCLWKNGQKLAIDTGPKHGVKLGVNTKFRWCI